jgi:hypothetical protein
LETTAVLEIPALAFAMMAGPPDLFAVMVLLEIVIGSLPWIAPPAMPLVLLKPMKLDSTFSFPFA